MKKSFILASILFSTSAFSIVSMDNNGQCFTSDTSIGCGLPKGLFSSIYDVSSSRATACAYDSFWISNQPSSDQYPGVSASPVFSTSCPNCSTGKYINSIQSCGSCGSGTVWNNGDCIVPQLSQYNNDPDGCSSAGGYYFNDGYCVSGTDAIAKIFQDPLAVTGSFLIVNGLAWSAAGLLLAATPAGAATALTWGTFATLAGIGSIAISAANAMYTSPDSPSPTNDVTLNDGTRLKVSLDNYENTQIVKADTTSGKVASISTIPPEVKQRIIDGVVNPTTGLPDSPLSPSDFAGTKTTSFDYSSNTATTQTVQSDGSITTETTPITTVQNTDGSVTTSGLDSSIAPTVTGTKGSTIDVPEWNQYSTIAQWTETTSDDGTGSTGSTDTGGGSTGGDSTGTDPETGEDTFEELSIDDGSGNFGSLTDQVTDAFDDFKINNPLNLPCSSTLSIDPIYFDLHGKRFTLLDNEILSYVPAELFRTILLFVAAVSGIILVFVGGI